MSLEFELLIDSTESSEPNDFNRTELTIILVLGVLLLMIGLCIGGFLKWRQGISQHGMRSREETAALLAHPEGNMDDGSSGEP